MALRSKGCAPRNRHVRGVPAATLPGGKKGQTISPGERIKISLLCPKTNVIQLVGSSRMAEGDQLGALDGIRRLGGRETQREGIWGYMYMYS